MGNCERCKDICDENELNTKSDQINNTLDISNKESLIKCTYEIKDFNETQIINYRGKVDINEDIKAKIKILNNNQRENLIFKKIFNQLGLNIIYFVIEEKLNDMSFMFNNCKSLKKIEFISPKTEEVTNMSSMFQNCEELEYIDLSNFNTNNVTTMESMFNNCLRLKQIKGISKINTNLVTNMEGMFQNCEELEYLDLSNFNTANVNNMACFFNECHKLKKIKGIDNFDTSKVTDYGRYISKL